VLIIVTIFSIVRCHFNVVQQIMYFYRKVFTFMHYFICRDMFWLKKLLKFVISLYISYFHRAMLYVKKYVY
jgi:hypothetical protein